MFGMLFSARLEVPPSRCRAVHRAAPSCLINWTFVKDEMVEVNG